MDAGHDCPIIIEFLIGTRFFNTYEFCGIFFDNDKAIYKLEKGISLKNLSLFCEDKFSFRLIKEKIGVSSDLFIVFFISISVFR